MNRLREMIGRVIKHRVFMPVFITTVALVLGVLFAFEHSRNLLKVRGPYLLILAAIITFPVFAFRFFDPHEDSRPISGYFVLVAVYYIVLGSPDFVSFLRMVLFERMPPGTVKQLIFGVSAFAALAGGLHYALTILLPETDAKQKFLAISALKFSVYALLHVIYLNLFVAIAREKFGITTVFS
jgi:hypothetical protein